MDARKIGLRDVDFDPELRVRASETTMRPGGTRSPGRTLTVSTILVGGGSELGLLEG